MSPHPSTSPRSERRRKAGRLRLIVLWLLALATLGAILWLAGREPRPPRHLVLVVLDTLRADQMSIYNPALDTTPGLVAAAGELLRFAEAKAPAPWTVPSHSSLFTGLWPSRHRAQWGSMRLSDRFETLAEALGGEGFCTAGVSANPLVAASTGLDQGFESFELVRGPWREKTAKILARLPALLDEADARRCRLFLFLNLMDAHIPYNAWRYAEQYGVEAPGPVKNAAIKWQISAGERPLEPEEMAQHRAAYAAAVRYLDDAIGELFGILRTRGVLDESLVVLTSDHGDGLGAHPEMGHSISLWEEQLAVPLLIRLPHARRGGEVVTRRVSLTALTPTLLDWLRVSRPSGLRGAPDLFSSSGDPVVADYKSYFSEENRNTNVTMAERYPALAERVADSHAIYCDPFKLIVTALPSSSFFDLSRDPDEQIDLAGSRPPELRACLRRYQLAADRGLFTPFGAGAEGERDEEGEPEIDLEILRALGYVQ